MLNDVACMAIDNQIAETFATVRTNQLATGTLTPSLDLFIAAVALAQNFTLVTDNTADFSAIPNLRLVNWLK
jgi:tRNA(fMet)-specific endonuclease VapC